MKLTALPVEGVMSIEMEPHVDARGGFGRAFCADTFAAHGLATHFPHANMSWNAKAGTLRGLHFQVDPKPEAKLVRATRGRVFDVAVDLRPASPTYQNWAAVELDAGRHNAIYIPTGCAHGYLTLEDDSEIFYLVSEVYAPALARDLRWNDRAFAIEWPSEPLVMSDKDASAPFFRDLAAPEQMT
jgi:dTDP-4-dehydrorhamnose 3,5-epimerase